MVSIRNNSFFSGSHLKLNENIGYNILVVKKCMKLVIRSIQSFTGLTSFGTFVPTIIGGPGSIIEIDESKFGKRKYNQGRYVEGHWVFGGIE